VPDWSPVHFESQPTYDPGWSVWFGRLLLTNLEYRTSFLESWQPPGYWEEQLSAAIEERHPRHWPRRVVRRVQTTWRYSRYATAIAVLRGHHYCGDDW
jgi:hypothetical protein